MKTKKKLKEKQYSCYSDLQNRHDVTAWVLIVTPPLAPLTMGHLYTHIILYIKY